MISNDILVQRLLMTKKMGYVGLGFFCFFLPLCVFVSQPLCVFFPFFRVLSMACGPIEDGDDATVDDDESDNADHLLIVTHKLQWSEINSALILLVAALAHSPRYRPPSPPPRYPSHPPPSRLHHPHHHLHLFHLHHHHLHRPTISFAAESTTSERRATDSTTICSSRSNVDSASSPWPFFPDLKNLYSVCQRIRRLKAPDLRIKLFL
ncbi:uncharacterized protein LOC122072504 [Macadamia integrifolia]|uniref:uncharacterized protein LOC122072504 n=1 Tax=Macadamia integrifolia TaxID=60698 RepID=UPI001C4EAED2|nr:uncharacterized protein LOC122072504 [Macadamia integrifolia]